MSKTETRQDIRKRLNQVIFDLDKLVENFDREELILTLQNLNELSNQINFQFGLCSFCGNQVSKRTLKRNQLNDGQTLCDDCFNSIVI